MPGHHLQISLAQESRDTPMLLKLSPFGAYTEGWALYAEQLADELGVYEGDPLGRAGMLQSSCSAPPGWSSTPASTTSDGAASRRPITWSRTTGFARAAHPARDRPLLRLARPGVQLQGRPHRLDRGCAPRPSRRSGSRFDLRQFHQILLKGAMPLTILEQQIDRWVASQQA